MDKYSLFKYICGVDEAGAGPLAGPVVAAAVILPAKIPDIGIKDSKKISEKRRFIIADKIKEMAIEYKISIIDNNIIDNINILQARLLAMKNAIESLKIIPDICLIDGNVLPDISIFSEAIIKGDSKNLSIAAASILAKTERDKIMIGYDLKFPEYKFLNHKGYGTKFHIDAIKKYGLSPIHRHSFCLKFLEN